MTADKVRELLIDELDPASGAVALVLAHLVDAPDPATTSDDLVAIVTNAMTSGRTPIGPIEYANEPIDYGLRTNAPVASIKVVSGQQITLHLALALSGSHIGVGGGRAGHMPHMRERMSPWVVFLPDVEAGLAELVAYVHERAALLSYRGRVRATLELVSAEPIVPAVVDHESGRLELGAPLPAVTPITFEYSIDISEREIDAIVYAAAKKLAERFGTPEPQFLTPP